MIRSFPPQPGHFSASTSSARWSSCAHVDLRVGLSGDDGSIPDDTPSVSGGRGMTSVPADLLLVEETTRAALDAAVVDVVSPEHLMVGAAHTVRAPRRSLRLGGRGEPARVSVRGRPRRSGGTHPVLTASAVLVRGSIRERRRRSRLREHDVERAAPA
jgi:hypothetical protein